MTENQIVNFVSPRGGSNAWARRDDLIDAWITREQTLVPPLSVEYSPVLLCDADCRLCPFRRSRLAAQLEQLRVGVVPKADDVFVATRGTATRVIDSAADAGAGGIVFTGGGEPLLWSELVYALRYSTERGLDCGIYTNALRAGIECQLAEEILSPEISLAFVRVSVNALSPRAVELHWGIQASEIQHQIRGLQNFLEARGRLFTEYKRVPSIQVSTIIDKNNVDDLDLICETLAGIVGNYPDSRGPEDVMIVRPLTIHGRSEYSCGDHRDWVIDRIIEVCGANGGGRRKLERAGMRVFLGFGLNRVESGEFTSYSDLIAHEYAQRDIDYANGLFLTVGSDARVFLSTEYNCDQGSDWVIGDLKTQNVSEIYQSARRKEILERCNAERWGPRVSQPTARTARLNRIARAVMDGQLSRDDIAKIRSLSLTSHRLILD